MSLRNKCKLILGVARSDSHAVANHLIAMKLRSCGFDIVNLGVGTSLDEFSDALHRHSDAQAILIGSLNGHAFEDLSELPRLRSEGRLGRPIILGGNLSVGSNKDDKHLVSLYKLGVDYILRDADELDALLESLIRPNVFSSNNA